MNGPLEFRIVESPGEGVIDTLFPEIQDLINRVSEATSAARPDPPSNTCTIQ